MFRTIAHLSLPYVEETKAHRTIETAVSALPWPFNLSPLLNILPVLSSLPSSISLISSFQRLIRETSHCVCASACGFCIKFPSLFFHVCGRVTGPALSSPCDVFFVPFCGSEPDQYKQMSVPISREVGGDACARVTQGRSYRKKISGIWIETGRA